MSTLDFLLGVLWVAISLFAGYIALKALIRGYMSEKRIDDLTRKVHQIQEDLDQLERKTSSKKFKEK